MFLRLLKIGAFIFLLEYQVFFGQGDYSLVTGAGLAIMSFFCFLFNSRGFKHEAIKHKIMWFQQIRHVIFAVLYVGLIILSLFVGRNIGERLMLILALQAVVLVIFHSKRVVWLPKKKADSGKNTYNPALVSSFTIPSVFLFTLNFLIGGLIGQNIAFQFVLTISAIVFYEILAGRDRFVVQLEKKQISMGDFRHYLFHRWSKYLNFFLGIWFFLLLEQKGIIEDWQQLIILFFFLIIFSTHTYGMIKQMDKKSVTMIAVCSGIVVILEFIAGILFSTHIPPYLLTLLIFMIYDAGDIYIHYREFHDLSADLWSKKAAVYLLATIFISQLHLFEQDVNLNLYEISASVFGAETEFSLYQSDNAAEVELEQGSIEVSDYYNASTVRR